MSSRLDQASSDAGLFTMFLAAAFSLLLGAVLAALFLVFKPVETVREIPKDAVAGRVFFVAGEQNSAMGHSQWQEMRQALLAGRTVVLTEEALNAAAVSFAAQPAQPAKKTAEKESKKTEQWLTAGQPNFRIRDDVLQAALPVTARALEYEFKFIVQTRGDFVKKDGRVTFVPTSMHVGSCPVGQLPWVPGKLLQLLVDARKVPENLREAWARLSDARVEGSRLHLVMP